MQNTSALYKSILASDHWFETKLDINGVGSYDESVLFACNTSHKMFTDTPEIGKAIAGEIDVEMLKPTVDIPRMAELHPFVRACNASEKSEWIPQGVFFIDTRESSKNGNNLDILTIHGYDAMMKAEQPFVSETITGDATDIALVYEIASIIGVEVDDRTEAIMTGAYTIPLPVGYSCREVLGYIASMYVGGFIISEEGKLRLVSLLELPPETNYLITEDADVITFGGVRILV